MNSISEAADAKYGLACNRHTALCVTQQKVRSTDCSAGARE